MIADILIRLAKGVPVTDDDLERMLALACDELHACDCDRCPVYQVRNGDIDRLGTRSGCDAFGDGHEMLAIIRSPARTERPAS